jgi:acyl transferase domain-containing protein/acyl carrier protein
VSARQDPVAIVGVGLRFPGGNDTLAGFEEFLRRGSSGIGPLPRDRWDEHPDGLISTVAGGFLDRVDEFDAQFFNISPKQAPYLDPAQRLLLETAWAALEQANIDPTPLRHGAGGVYVGASPLDFALELGALAPEQLDGALSTGLGGYSLSGRLSYFLGWRGPSLTTDTACASSLTALHLAAEGLRRGECDIALCGAVNVLHNARSYVILSQAQMLSPDGRCKTFDEAADGYARAEGCGVLVLKRLADARRDGDTVLAVVRGTAIGQDGESAGLTAPNGIAQEAVMRAALAGAGLSPGDIQYVEAHGTGTPLGDPIEVGSIAGVYAPGRDAARPLTVGSLKSNLGHMEPAAGVGGVVKVLLQLRAGTFFPSLLDTPSGRIPWETYPLTVPRECRPWDAPVRRAAINGFGVTGAIGVIVLEQAPPAGAGAVPAGAHVVAVSAKSGPALRRQLERLRAAAAGTDLAALAATSTAGRAHFRHRAAAVAASTDDLAATLDRALDTLDSTAPEQFRKVAFLFTGSGSQYAGMGAALYERYPDFRSTVDECDALFAVHIGRSIRELMFGAVPDAEALLLETPYAHAALFTLEYALARQWRAWGIRPTVLIGHSLGEIVAATVAGVFSPADGVRFVAARARIIDAVEEPGGMAAVAAPTATVAAAIACLPDLSIAAANSARQCVISGGSASLATAVRRLRERGLTVTPLKVSSGFHSPLLSGICGELRAVLEGIRLGEPELPVISNETGQVAPSAVITTPGYWVRHALNTVDFAAGVATIGSRGRHVFLEVGPAGSLLALARQNLPAERHRWLASLDPRDTAGDSIPRALAGLYTAGLNPAWAAVHGGHRWPRADLPGYAFDRDRYRLPRGTRQAGAGLHGSPEGTDLVARIGSTAPAYLADHTSNGRAFLPAAAYVEMLLALADARFGGTTGAVEHLRFHQAQFLSGEPTELRTSGAPIDGGLRAEIRGAGGALLVTATLGVPGESSLGADARALLSRAGNGADPDELLSAGQVYAAYARAGLDYGPQFRRVRRVERYGWSLAVSELDGTGVDLAEHLPPQLLDGATHGLAALIDDGHNYVATSIRRLRVFKKPRADLLRAVLRINRGNGGGTAFTIDVLLLEGELPVVELTAMGFTQLPRPVARKAAAPVAAPAEQSVPELVRGTVAGLLSIPDPARLDPYASFFELGVDSLVAVELAGTLGARLGIALPTAAVFDHPSIAQLADHLRRPVGTDTQG